MSHRFSRPRNFSQRNGPQGVWNPPRQKRTRWLAAHVEEGLCLRNHRHSPIHVHAVGEEENNRPVAKPQEWTKTLLARDEIDGWSGLLSKGRALSAQLP